MKTLIDSAIDSLPSTDRSLLLHEGRGRYTAWESRWLTYKIKARMLKRVRDRGDFVEDLKTIKINRKTQVYEEELEPIYEEEHEDANQEVKNKSEENKDDASSETGLQIE